MTDSTRPGADVAKQLRRAKLGDAHTRRVGEALVKLLRVRVGGHETNEGEPRYMTAAGAKTASGLARAVARTLQEGRIWW